MSIDSASRLGPLPEFSCVLIVDDEPMNVRLLEMALEPIEGLRIVSTTKSTEALAMYLEHLPDIVLLDLHMPVLGGIDLMKAIHLEMPMDDFVPVVVLTADISRESREAALHAGAHDFLTKPLDLTEVSLRIRNLLRTRSLHVNLQRDHAELAERLRRHESARREEEQRLAEETERIATMIERRDITVVFQPIVNLESRSTIGYEALSRFSGEPPRPPDRWFAEANSVGLGRQLELLAVDEAIRALDRIPRDRFLSVNLSPELLANGDFEEFMHDRDGDRLVVEFTEHVRIDDYAPLVDSMKRLRRRGLRFAVDDAGAGFASLQHILKLRPEIIKLDIALTRGIDSDPARRALASSLVFFANETDARIISEGIETDDEQSTLHGIGVHLGQGFLLGRPGPLPTME
ncbi:MAG TPA: EAL domain-containing protein [Acidimicrobiales bacterium]|nr:EAL domain-containing protein [Acidimicrobiales bacterium]